MRIALVTDMFLPRRGGIELHVADLAERLRRVGHHVDVLTPTPGPEQNGVRRLTLPLLPAVAVTIDPRLFDATRVALHDGAYDIVHCHASVFSPAAWVAMWAARRLRVPTVCTFHSVLHSSAYYLGGAYRLCGAKRWPLAVTGVSDLVARQARPVAPGAEVGVLPNGTDVTWWTRAARVRRGDGVLRIASAMRLTVKKRPAALLRIVARLVAANAPVRLTIAGDGAQRPTLEALAKSLGITEHVRLVGWRTRAELRTLYHATDAFVLPTRDEAFGIAALEARAAGVPVLAWRGTGVGDFVDDGRHGHLCTSDNDLAERLIALAHDRAALAALASTSRAEPPRAYDWSAVVARHEAAYAAVGAANDVRDLTHVLRHASESRRRAAARRH